MEEREGEKEKVEERKRETEAELVEEREKSAAKEGKTRNCDAIRKSLEKIQLAVFDSQVTARFRHSGRSWHRGRKKEE